MSNEFFRHTMRVAKAQNCLENYDEPETHYSVIDLLTDLMHLCKEEGYNFEECLQSAKMHFEHETFFEGAEED
jgi:hypothetical protein